MKKILYLLSICFCSLLLSCEEYLDAKPDKKTIVPSTLSDVNALLDYPVLATASVIAEGCTDNMYLLETNWNAISALRDRNMYVWENTDLDGDAGIWSGKYNHVFVCNVALDALAKITPGNNEVSEWQRLKGSALFLRSYGFFELLQLFAKPYQPSTAATDLGIPLKLNPDINEQVKRESLQKCYEQLIADMEMAIELLPINSSVATRPNQKSAYALLARIYLNMGDDVNAKRCADASLALYDELLDYNGINSAATAPFAKFNKEVIFHCTGIGVLLNPNTCRVDTLLYDSYGSNDLRKAAFFRVNGPKNYTFKGSYDGTVSSAVFAGFTTAELYLISAECAARLGFKEEALAALNKLLKNRWKQSAGTFVPLAAADAETALELVLSERRKELVFRGMRWNDLRRLNLEPKFATTLQRKLGTAIYVLSPNSGAYVFPIPYDVVQLSGITQNER